MKKMNTIDIVDRDHVIFGVRPALFEDAMPSSVQDAEKGKDKESSKPLTFQQYEVKFKQAFDLAKDHQAFEAMTQIRHLSENLGRPVSLETYVFLNSILKGLPEEFRATIPDVPATCTCCGDVVFMNGVGSAKTKLIMVHKKQRPVVPQSVENPLPTKTEERCRLRGNLNVELLKEKAEKEKQLAETGIQPLSRSLQAKQNRQNFYQQESVERFLLVVGQIFGSSFKHDYVYQMLRRADEDKLWSKVHNPWTAPYQLLAQPGLSYWKDFKNKNGYDISFFIINDRTQDDLNLRHTKPSDKRLYAYYRDSFHQGINWLDNFPGLDKDVLIQRDFGRAAMAATRRSASSQNTQLSSAQSLSAANDVQASANDFGPGHLPNYGVDRGRFCKPDLKGKEFLVINEETTVRIATSTRHRLGLKLAANDNPLSPDKQKNFDTFVADILARYGAEPVLVRRPRVSKAAQSQPA